VVAGLGAALLLAGLLVEGLREVGWWVIAGGLAVALVAFLARVGLASRRRLLALVLATATVAVVALAAIEVGRHGADDIDAGASVLPGNRSNGFEQTVRDATEEVWEHVWPW
jgi:hypothetical protein